MPIQIKAVEQFFPAIIIIIMLCMMVVSFEYVDNNATA